MRANKPIATALGIVLGIIFGVVQVSTAVGVPDEIRVAAYGVTTALVVVAFLPSATLGLISGVIAMIFLAATEFVYYSVTYGPGIAAGLMPYSALSLPRLLVPPLSGLLGGLVGAQYSTKSRRKRTKASHKVQHPAAGRKRRKTEQGRVTGTSEPGGP